MKKIFLLSLVTSILFLQLSSQSITPLLTSEQCPGVNVTFTVTLAGQDVTSVTPRAFNVNPTVVQQLFNKIISGGNVTFNFVGKFADNNNKQTFTANYTNAGGQPATQDFTFVKIKSLLTANTFSQIFPSPTSITSAKCQITSHTISFSNVQYGNPFEAPPIGYGTITNYEYLLPSGWKLGATTSNGTTWLPAGNNVTVTSDLSNGGGTNIRIRAANTACAAGLATGQEAVVSISRPVANLIITGSSDLCSGSKIYTVSGVPSGATVTWTATNPAVATITPSGNSCTVTQTGDGIVTLTATATVGTCTAGTTSKTIRVGYNYINASISGETTVLPNAGYGYTLSTNPYNLTIANIVWRVPTGWAIVNGQGTYTINVWTGTTGGAVQVDFDDACGVSTGRYLTVAVGSGGGLPQRPALKKNEDTTKPGVSISKDELSNQKFEGITIYPNPAKNNLNILISKSFINSTIIIMDGTGKILQTSSLPAAFNHINISKLPKGVYLIRLVSGTSFKSFKFIKK